MNHRNGKPPILVYGTAPNARVPRSLGYDFILPLPTVRFITLHYIITLKSHDEGDVSARNTTRAPNNMQSLK